MIWIFFINRRPKPPKKYRPLNKRDWRHTLIAGFLWLVAIALVLLLAI